MTLWRLVMVTRSLSMLIFSSAELGMTPGLRDDADE